MASNISELTYLYKKISVVEMVEKLKNGGIVWNQVSLYQYRATYFQGTDCWDMFLTKMPNQSTVTLDFKKNLKFFYSINSDSDPNVATLYNEVIGDEDFEKDKSLMDDITQMRTARGLKYNEYMHAGVELSAYHTYSYSKVITGVGTRASGSVTSSIIYGGPSLIPAGVRAAGHAPARHYNNIPITSAGVWANGSADVNSFILIVSAGVLAASSADLSEVYTPVIAANGLSGAGSATVSVKYNPATIAAGVLADGVADVTNHILIISAGVLAAGGGSEVARYTPSITAAGVRGNGSGTTNALYTPSITAAGVSGAGDATVDYQKNYLFRTAGGIISRPSGASLSVTNLDSRGGYNLALMFVGVKWSGTRGQISGDYGFASLINSSGDPEGFNDGSNKSIEILYVGSVSQLATATAYFSEAATEAIVIGMTVSGVNSGILDVSAGSFGFSDTGVVTGGSATISGQELSVGWLNQWGNSSGIGSWTGYTIQGTSSDTPFLLAGIGTKSLGSIQTPSLSISGMNFGFPISFGMMLATFR